MLLVMPTGAGKTRTAASYADSCVRRGKRVLWVAHRRELVLQASGTLRQFDLEVGEIIDGKPSTNPAAPVQVAMVQTLAASKRIPQASVIIADEAQHGTASTWLDVFSSQPEAEVLGLSATPERTDGVGLGEVFQRLVAPVSIGELTARGVLVPCKVYGPPKPIDALAMDPFDAYLRHVATPTEHPRAVVFSDSVESARELADRMTAGGVRAACVDGAISTDEREAKIEAFKRGEIRVLTNVFCVTEGYDDPELSNIILARGCGSASMFLQIVGRALRSAPGKTHATLVDLRGAVHRHGLPEEERVYSLDGRSLIQRVSGASLSSCRKCGAIFPSAPTCPRCGAKVSNGRTGTRVLAGSEALEHIRATATRKEKLSYWERMCRQAKEHGYKPGWAAFRYKAFYGDWPPRDFPRFDHV